SSFVDRLGPVAFSWHSLFLQHAHGTLASRLRRHPPLSCPASFPHSSGLARDHLVRDDFRVLGQPFRRSPAPYLQRQALLVSRYGMRRDYIMTLRQPQRFCPFRGITSAFISRFSGLGKG